MRITTYRTELDENLHNVLIKENACNYPVESLNNPEIVVDMLNSVYRLNMQAEEYVYMIAFNTKQKVLGVFEVSHGTVDASICNPRDIFIKALLCGASGIILAHNHPSGDIRPSQDDLSMCRRISDAGKLIGIELLDNFVIGNNYYSFREMGLM